LAVLAAAPDTTLLQFSSQRCQHCQSMQPVVAQLARQGVNVQTIDVDQQLSVARQFQINGVPTYVAVSGGREVGRIEGVAPPDKLAALVGFAPLTNAPPGWDTAASAAISPPTRTAASSPDAARAATVRIKVEDAAGYGFGTGTIIDTHDSESLVVTCGHLFRESKGQGKITADLFVSGAAQTVDGQLIGYDLDRDIALISVRIGPGAKAAAVAPPGYTVRPGDRAFTIGCDKGADPSVRQTHITAVNKYRGKPNFTAAGQPIDGRSGGGLFSADGFLIGICNAADPKDDEGLYAGLASIHWQLDQIGQSEIYQRSALASVAPASAGPAVAAANVALAGQAGPQGSAGASPSQLSASPSQLSASNVQAGASLAQIGLASQGGLPPQAPPSSQIVFPTAMNSPAPRAVEVAPVVAAGDDTEIVFIVRSKRDPSQRSDVYVVDQAPPDLVARITHAARASGEQRAALASRAAQPAVRTAAAGTPRTGSPVIRGQSSDY
jgi:S1-C subfamily serine protease